MSKKKRLLIVAHAPSENTKKMLDALERGACDPEIENVEVQSLAPLETQPENIQSADAIIIGTTENLGYMAGLVKDVFDRCYYPCLEVTQGLPLAFYIRAGHDGTGTLRAMESITTGLRWKLVHEPLVCRGDYRQEFEEQCRQLGLYMAASLEAGVI